MTSIAIVTFDGFNEIDSFVALNILNRVQCENWRAVIVSPSQSVVSANGVRIESQESLEFANQADAVLIGSGRLTRRMVEDPRITSRFKLNPGRQLIGSQCSGALLLDKLGLLEKRQVCTDRVTRPLVEAAGIEALNQPLTCYGNVASAGGCLASHYLAAWMIWRLADKEAARQALEYVVPAGEEALYIDRALQKVKPFV